QLARLLPAVEIGCALALLLGIAARWMASALLILLLVFSAALASAWWRHLPLPCHCFGEADPGKVSSFPRSLLRNAGLGVVALSTGLAPAPALRGLFPALLIDPSYQLGFLCALIALALLLTVTAVWTVFASARKQHVFIPGQTRRFHPDPGASAAERGARRRHLPIADHFTSGDGSVSGNAAGARRLRAEVDVCSGQHL
ncbi:MAG: hypothetical protein IRZ31_21100, partial [Thermogemmatispora sp.]|nr:hypothetical protein [Thermogemmatispora sp.]